MSTKRETVRLLCKSIINRLENRKSIEFAPRLRELLLDDYLKIVSPHIMTDQDVHEKALAKMGAKSEALQETQFAESDQYRTAQKMVKESFGDDVLNGFYFIKPVRHVATVTREFLLRSSHIDDVFETDEDLEKAVIEIIQKFNPAELR